MKPNKQRLQRFLKQITVILLFLLTVRCALLTVNSYAAIPKLINYQGRLLDSQGRPLADGKYKITFKIYDSSGNPIWTELHDPAQGTGIQIEKGIFNVMLGGVTPLNLTFEQQYSLGIQVGSDAEMTPRQLLASSAYAIRANVADEALQAQNATKVNNIEASTTPQANKLLPLDSNAKIPSSALGLKVYDSGWFPVSTSDANHLKTFTHNLGTKLVLPILYFSDSADGSTNCSTQFYHADWANGSYNHGGGIMNITTTQVTVGWTYRDVASLVNNGGGWIGYSSGYYRLILLALE